MMGYYGYGGMGGIGMIVGLVITIALIVGVVLFVVWAVRRINRNSAQPGSQNVIGQSAKDIAQVRYARGEINREEYQRLLSDLAN